MKGKLLLCLTTGINYWFILQYSILKKYDPKVEQGQVAGSCVRGNETTGSKKRGEFFD
jgi:hypothetical protein